MAKTQSGGLGPRGFDALFGGTNAKVTMPMSDEPKTAEATEALRAESEKAAREVAAMPEEAARVAAVAERVAEPEPVHPVQELANLHPALHGDVLADSIDVHFSLSEPEIVERAPRKAPTPAADAFKAAAQVAVVPYGAIAEIALENIELNPYQPRLRFKQEPLDELVASIARDGLLQPITVRPLSEGRYQIISGERRFRASQLAGLRSIPAYVREAADREMGQFALIENLQREDLNPIEAAIGYRNLMKAQNLTQSEVAQLLCKGRSTIANTLRLLELPEDLQEMIYNEQLTEGHARAIQQVPTAEGRRKLADKVIAEGLSVRATENLARFMAGKPAEAGEHRERTAVPAAFKAVARTLKQHLGTNVKVKNAGGKNRIEIEFADAEDLERICSQILKSEGITVTSMDVPVATGEAKAEGFAEETAE